jgi:DNA replication licensing factor MCM2
VVTTTNENTISQDLLKKYIMYARRNCHPKFPSDNIERVMNFYAELRKESQMRGGISIVARHIESLIRMAQSSAKMHLRQEVKKEDVDIAISVLCKICLTKWRVSSRVRS